MSLNTGWQAFPSSGGLNQFELQLPIKDMTLRDYFAAKAMASMLGNTDLLRAIPSGPDQDDAITKAAYEMADAMLKARQA